MAAEPKTIAEYPACTTPSSNDLLLAWGNSAANTLNITTGVLAAANLDTVVSSLIISNTSTPANSTVGGFANLSIWMDNDFIYVTLANGHIRRAAIADF